MAGVVKINYNKVNLSGSSVTIHPIGDLHLGHINSDINFIKEILKEIPKNDNHRIILMGDLLDIGIKSSIAGSVYENNELIDTAMDTLYDLLEPFKGKIDAVVTGNHEWRVFKETGIDLTKQIARNLNATYMKHSGVVTYSINKKAYNVNMFHGRCGGGIENALRHCKAMSNKVIADVYLMGHVHACASTKRQIKIIDSRNRKITESTQYFVLTGHALEYDDSYADQMNLEINTKGFPSVVLSGNSEKKIIEIIT